MMHVEWTKLTIYQGADSVLEGTVLDADDNPMDLNTGTPQVEFNMGRDWGDDPLIEKTLASGITGDAQGLITVTVPGSETETLNPAYRYVFTCWVAESGDELDVASRGQITVDGTVRASP